MISSRFIELFFPKLFFRNCSNRIIIENNFFRSLVTWSSCYTKYICDVFDPIARKYTHKLLRCTRVRARHVELHPRAFYVRAHAATGQRTGCNARKSRTGCERVEQRGGVGSRRMKASCKRSIESGEEFCRGNDDGDDDSKKDEKV